MISSQNVYQAGEQLRVNLPALPANEKQYIAVSYPDQSLYFMTGLNGLVLFDGRSVPYPYGKTVAKSQSINP